MGLSAAYNNICDLTPEQEIEFLEKRFNRVALNRLHKTHEISWWNGSETYAPGSTLDHVFADPSLNFRDFGGGKYIKVIGWPELTSTAEQLSWIDKYSDHGLLFGEIHT